MFHRQVNTKQYYKILYDIFYRAIIPSLNEGYCNRTLTRECTYALPHVVKYQYDGLHMVVKQEAALDRLDLTPYKS